MGTITDSLFNALMSWMRGLVNSLWALFTTDNVNVLEIFGRYWLPIVGIILIVGLVVDWLIWLIRWQPYHLWAIRMRKLLHIEEPEEDAEEPEMPEEPAPQPEEPLDEMPEEETQWTPENALYLGEEDKRRAMEQAESVPDAEIGAYPGMRYGAESAQITSETQRFSAVRSEGPGAAEVAKRRAEIDAWQKQQEEEARAQAAAQLAAQEEAKRQQEAAQAAERARLEQEAQAAQLAAQEEAKRQQEAAQAAERARLEQEEYQRKLAEYEKQKAAYEAEQARLAQEEYQRQLAEYEKQKAAYEAEQARLAQEEYQRQLAEYERQKAQYELELKQYERQKAQMEARAQAASRRRAPENYSSYVQGEDVGSLPDAPKWPNAQDPRRNDAPNPQRREGTGRLAKLAQLIETEEEDVKGIAALPPRVDQREAYKPTKKPVKRKR